MDSVYCVSCERGHPISVFTPSQVWCEGTRGYCKECCKRKREARKGLQRAYARKHYVENRDEYLRRSREWSAENRERSNTSKGRYKKNHRIKHAGHAAVKRAIERGELRVATQCCIDNDRCSGPLEAHHSDYSKPLEVQWLCKTHHGAWHHLFEPEVPNGQE